MDLERKTDGEVLTYFNMLIRNKDWETVALAADHMNLNSSNMKTFEYVFNIPIDPHEDIYANVHRDNNIEIIPERNITVKFKHNKNKKISLTSGPYTEHSLAKNITDA